MKNGNFLPIIVAAVAVIVVAAVVLFSQTSDTNNVDTNTSDTDSKTAMNADEAMEVEYELMTELEDVSGGESTGTGYISRTDGLMHYVEASMPDPEEGSVYEGWLVRQTPTLDFFSTGIMEKREDGMYTLQFSSEMTYDDHNFVVITLETVVDDTPEAHILEGTVDSV